MVPTIKLYQKIKAFLTAMVTNDPAIPPTATSVDGIPVWTVDPNCEANDAILAPELDGLSCEVIPGVKSGLCNVQVIADAKKGEGVNNISTVFVVDIEPLEADRLDVTFDAPQPK